MNSTNPATGYVGPPLRRFLLTRPLLPSPVKWLTRPLNVPRILAIATFTVVLALLATFRTFGFDSLQYLYPDDVADGWGIWHWLAHIGLSFYPYLLLLNLMLSFQILTFVFPRHKWRFSVAMVGLTYLCFWDLFGQARYGMAMLLLASSALTGSIPLLLIGGGIASFVHRGVAGGLILFAAWLYLRDRKGGVWWAALFSIIGIVVVKAASLMLLLVAGYANYGNWDTLPSTNTAVKYYYILLLLLAWKIKDHTASNRIMVLTLLFLPFAYFNVFAGRSYMLYAVALLGMLHDVGVPRLLRALLLILYIADVFVLLFISGHYF